MPEAPIISVITSFVIRPLRIGAEEVCLTGREVQSTRLLVMIVS